MLPLDNVLNLLAAKPLGQLCRLIALDGSGQTRLVVEKRRLSMRAGTEAAKTGKESPLLIGAVQPTTVGGRLVLSYGSLPIYLASAHCCHRRLGARYWNFRLLSADFIPQMLLSPPQQGNYGTLRYMAADGRSAQGPLVSESTSVLRNNAQRPWNTSRPPKLDIDMAVPSFRPDVWGISASAIDRKPSDSSGRLR